MQTYMVDDGSDDIGTIGGGKPTPAGHTRLMAQMER